MFLSCLDDLIYKLAVFASQHRIRARAIGSLPILVVRSSHTSNYWHMSTFGSLNFWTASFSIDEHLDWRTTAEQRKTNANLSTFEGNQQPVGIVVTQRYGLGWERNGIPTKISCLDTVLIAVGLRGSESWRSGTFCSVFFGTGCLPKSLLI